MKAWKHGADKRNQLGGSKSPDVCAKVSDLWSWYVSSGRCEDSRMPIFSLWQSHVTNDQFLELILQII